MSILVIAEHNNIEVKSSTLNTISAAAKLGDEIEVLVLGSNIENISKEISTYQHVSKVIFFIWFIMVGRYTFLKKEFKE